MGNRKESDQENVYEISLSRANAEKLGKLAEDVGYQDDCQYLEDVVNSIIEQRYEHQLQLFKTETTQ